MDMEELYAGDLEEAALLALLEEKWLLSGLFLGERLPQEIIAPDQRQDLLWFQEYAQMKENERSPLFYTTGRVFQEDGELRWEKRGESWRVVYLGQARPFSRLHPVESFPRDERREKSYYLFGKPLRKGQIPGLTEEENVFAEARIPRLLQYRPAPPAPGGDQQRLCLGVYEYPDREGRVRAFRFANLAREEKRQHESV